MDLKILWMYNDLMDLYGDKGNIQVLKTRAEKRNINVTVKTCSLNEEVDIRLQLIMWNMIDKLKVEGSFELDYLQVFKIRKEEKKR